MAAGQAGERPGAPDELPLGLPYDAAATGAGAGAGKPRLARSQPIPKTAAQRRRDRNGFKRHAVPSELMSRAKAEVPAVGSPPEDLRRFVEWIEGQQDSRQRFAWVLRDSLDELFDGQRTGRWCYQHVTSKTERAHLGTMIEINLTKEFSIPNGEDLDWRVAGYDLDCKFSKEFGAWEIPMEMYLCSDHAEQSGAADHPALVVWVQDDTSRWAAGVVRITDDMLAWKQGGSGRRAYNRDNKRKIAMTQRHRIHWLFGGMQTDLPANTLLRLSEGQHARIFADGRSGQKRVDALFRECQQQLIRRPVVLTVAQQDDAPKRARDARTHLRAEGLLVLGHATPHPQIARDLGLDVPSKGEWLSVKLAPVDDEAGTDRLTTQYAGRRWALWREGDPVPLLPRASDDSDD